MHMFERRHSGFRVNMHGATYRTVCEVNIPKPLFVVDGIMYYRMRILVVKDTTGISDIKAIALSSVRL